MTSFVERIATAARRLPAAEAEAVARVLEAPDELVARRDELLAELLANDEAELAALNILDPEVERLERAFREAEVAYTAAKGAVWAKTGQRQSVRAQHSHKRESLVRELTRTAPPSYTAAVGQARERLMRMSSGGAVYPADFRPEVALRARDQLNALARQPIGWTELEAEATRLLSLIPTFQDGTR